MILRIVSCMLIIVAVVGQYHVTNILQHANVIYPEIDSETVSYYRKNIHKNKWHMINLLEKTEDQIRQGRRKRDGLYGNFDPNAFNSQIGSSFNPNAFGSGSGSSGTSMFNMAGNGMSGTGTGSGSTSGGGTAGMSMFNPNAMTGFGTGGTSGSNSGTSGGSTTMTGGSSSGGPSSGGQPNYDPNNVINTGAKYDPNAANSGMGGSGGATPSFANGMGLNATQKLPSGGGAFGAATGSGSGGSSTTGSGSAPSNPASAFGSASSSSGSLANSFGSPSSAATSFGSASASTGSSPSGLSGSQSSGTQSSGSGMVPMGSGSMVNRPANMAPPGTGGTTSGSGTPPSGSGFDPISTNSMATSGFNPLNPMMGKDMNLVMGPQSSTGSTGPGNFDPGKMNAQLGSQGMSLNMFGGAGGNTDLNKADASSVMTGASGMMAGSNAINNGGNAVMSGGNTGMGTGMGTGSASTGTSSTSGSSGGSTFDPNKMSSGSGTGSGTGSTSSNSSATGGMFNPNAMMGGGSLNPMMPGGSTGMNPMMPGGSTGMNPMMPGSSAGMNPMMPSGSMTGTSSGTRVSSGSSGSTSGSSSTPLDPLGAMTGGAKNFSGGNSLIDPQGFMQGGGLTGSMGNMFSMTSRDINDAGHVQRSTKFQQREKTLRSLLTGSGFYNPMDPMGFIFEGNNKQYTEGNGKDTAPFDPNKFAFAYAAQVFGSRENAFIPGFVSAHEAQTSATMVRQNNNTPTEEPRNVANTTVINNSTSEQKEQMFFGLPVLSMRPYEILHENNMDHLLLNSSILFPEVAFSGKPGMLGIGSQTPVQPLKIDQGPKPEQQFIPPELKNISETSISPSSYNGYPGMAGVGQQQPARIQDGARLTTPRPEYNGYPGMIGDGHMIYTNVGINASTGSSRSNNRSSHGDQTIKDSANHNYIAMPSSSNWKGEWPGKTSSSRDWSGSWSEKWPSSTDPDTKDVTQNNTHELPSGHTINIVHWDGSWPGNEKNVETATSTTENNPDNLSQVIASLEKLVVLLQNSASSPNHNGGGIEDDKHDSQRTFGQMAASWKDDMKVAMNNGK